MDIVMPQLGETVTEGTVTVWHKRPGETVGPDETLFEVATDKVDTEVPAPAAGVLAEILVAAGETVGVGTRLAVLRIAGDAAAPAPDKSPAPEPAKAAPAPAPAKGDGPKLSPVVRRLLAEHGLDAAAIAGTGRDGRIRRDDVLAHVAAGAAAKAPAPAPDGDRTVVPFGTIRKRTAAHMVRSRATSAHVLQAVEADFHRVARARGEAGPGFKARHGFSLTYLPFVARAACRAIADYPHVNASIDGESLVVWRDVHLAIAIDLDFEGLVAPVIRNAQNLSVAELARAIQDLALRARANALTPDDFSGGTYTISNSGAFGTLITAPIINQPQVAILSTDGVRKRPVAIETGDGDAIAIRPVGVLAQSFDHRAIDGAYSAAFLNRLRDIVEVTDWTAEID